MKMTNGSRSRFGRVSAVHRCVGAVLAQCFSSPVCGGVGLCRICCKLYGTGTGFSLSTLDIFLIMFAYLKHTVHEMIEGESHCIRHKGLMKDRV